MQIVYKMRLRDRHSSDLNRQAHAVNFVWNYCNETQRKAVNDSRRWLSAFDLSRLTSGSSKELNLHAHTIQRVCQTYDHARRKHNKPFLRWRGDRSLGWVPFNTGHMTFDGEVFKFRGMSYQTMHIRGELCAGVKIAAGSFNCDARGKWYLNVTVDVDVAESAPVSRVGIDLGLRKLATLSNGREISAPRFYRSSEMAMAKAQRAKKSKRYLAIHAKVANRRKDFLHKASAAIAQEFGLIVIGDVNSSNLAKTSMAKSVFDAGWSGFKQMLSYKAIRHGGSTLEVSEYLTTQVCSGCGAMPPSRPKGIAGLRIREWKCDECDEVHDRDVNAAKNILRIGLDALVEGASASCRGVATGKVPQ